MFRPDELEPADTFAQRLERLVHDALNALGARGIALADLGSPEGQVAPFWRAAAPSRPTPLTLAALHALTTGPSERPGDDPAVVALGPPFVGGWARVVPLRVVPVFASAGDALLVLAFDSADRASRPDVLAGLAALVTALERGLSHDRRQRVAELLYAAIESAPDAIEVTDTQARLVYANHTWSTTFGHPRELAAGRTVGELFRDPVRPVHDAAFYQFTTTTLAAGEPWIGSLACRTADGGRVFCEVAVHPFDGAGFRGNFAVRRALHHRERRDRALAVAHHELRSVLASLPDGVAVLREGRLYFVNAALLGMLRLDEASVIGEPFRDLVHPDDRAAFDTGLDAGPCRVRIPTRDGVRIAELSSVGSVSFEGVPSAIVMSRDTTDLRIAEEQLSRAEKLSALGALAAGVAHEINNPLAYVILNLEMLRDSRQVLDPAAIDALREAIDGAKRIHRIAGELRGFSGSDAPGPPEPVDLASAIRNAVNIAQNELRHRGRLELDLAGELTALAREGQVVQVLVNVLVNAAQALPDDQSADPPRIGIRLSAGEDNRGAPVALIEVRDDGVGIDPEALPHVFDPFFSTRRRGDGAGLGLAISKRIVESYGGRIALSSELGHGTTVTIAFPRMHAPTVRAASPPRRTARLNPRRVLIIDDEVPIARALSRLLTGHDVVVANDSVTALDALDGAAFDVVLCDLMMPSVPGPELYRRACARDPGLADRFVFMTGGAFTESASAFLATVKGRVLIKPFDPSTVLRYVESPGETG